MPINHPSQEKQIVWPHSFVMPALRAVEDHGPVRRTAAAPPPFPASSPTGPQPSRGTSDHLLCDRCRHDPSSAAPSRREQERQQIAAGDSVQHGLDLACVLVLAAAPGFRAWNIGTDTWMYTAMYDMTIDSDSWSNTQEQAIVEPGYAL